MLACREKYAFHQQFSREKYAFHQQFSSGLDAGSRKDETSG